jgi:hypothetical protein
MSENLKFGNLATVHLVPSVATTPMSLQKVVEKDLGHGAPASLAEVRRLLGDLKILMPLTDGQKKRLAYLSGMASRIRTRVTSGKATIAELHKAAKEADGEEMFVKDFVNIVFQGYIKVRDTKRSWLGGKTYDGYITKQYCLGFAKDWDSMGKVDPIDFVWALSIEAEGHKNYVSQEEAMEQIFRYARGIRPTPTTEVDGYPASQSTRWDW